MSLYILILIVGAVIGALGMGGMVMMLRAYHIIQQEQARRRHTHNTDHGLLDVQAQINYLEFNLREIVDRAESMYGQLGEARKRVGNIRQGPYAYREEQGDE